MVRTSVVVAVLLLAFATCATAAFQYKGELTTAYDPSSPGIYDGALVATLAWSPVTLAWTVSYDPSVSPWVSYEYVITATGKGVSHVLIEASQATGTLPAFAESDIISTNWQSSSPDADDVSVQNWTSQQGNPDIPGGMYGIKFNTIAPLPSGSTDTSWTIRFYSDRMPTWGDFYTKDGVSAGTMQTAWNAGFLTADPTAPASDGSIQSHVLVPDTAVVPELPTALPLSIGLSLMGLIKRRGLR